MTSVQSKPGVNTAVFGKLQWPLIHGTAYILQHMPQDPSRRDCEAFAKMLAATKKTMPCRFCRASFARFVDAELKATRCRSPAEWVRHRMCFDVTVSLHDRVSEKLDAQWFEGAADLRSRRVPDASIAKVYRALPSYIHPRDVFDLLMLYCMNAQTLCASGKRVLRVEDCDTADMCAALADLVACMPWALRLQERHDRIGGSLRTREGEECLRAARVIEASAQDFSEACRTRGGMGMFDACFSMFLEYTTGGKDIPLDAAVAARDATLRRLGAAASNVCKAETCA